MIVKWSQAKQEIKTQLSMHAKQNYFSLLLKKIFFIN